MGFLPKEQQESINKVIKTELKTVHLLNKRTRFRAFQLGNPGSSFSYYDGSSFTLIEARVSDLSRPRIIEEMQACEITSIGCLSITSWDADHCAVSDLEEILETWKPRKVEHPGYNPHTDTGEKCLRLINLYKTRRPNSNVISVDPAYLETLEIGEHWGYINLLLWPKIFTESKSNDNSIAQLYRTGSFNVLSLGDLESEQIACRIVRSKSIRNETDVLILAHHGADNGFTSKKFLAEVSPRVAVCSSDFDNKYEHPDDEISSLLYEMGINKYTSKTGDILIQSVDPHTKEFTVTNFKANSNEISSISNYPIKKAHYLGNHQRAGDYYARKKNPFKKFGK